MQKLAGEGSVPPLGLVRAFAVLWWTAGIVVFYLGAKTAYQGLQRGSGHDLHLVLLGSVEALAALLFLIPRSLRIGAVALLLVFAAAFLLHALRFELRGDLLVYAGAVSFVAVHGPVPVSWLRAGRTGP
jgi:uncharacterized membrane protein YphA (DoxX/SURF4 family)